MPPVEAPPTPCPAATDVQEAADLESEQHRKSSKGRRMSRSRSKALRRSSANNPQVSRYQDHFSLQAPTSYVRFHDSKSAARVIYNQSSQLVIEEKYDPKTDKRRVTVKQMSEESSNALRIFRLSYTLVAAFFLGFLVVFTMQVMLFVALDFAIHAGLTDVQQDVNVTFSVGILFAFPILIHGFALIMMLAGLFLSDLWRGHPLFRKFVLPNHNDELVEWMFVLCLLVLPFCVIGGTLVVGRADWWEISALYWFFSVLIAYLVFVVSVLLYETRVFLLATVGLGWIEDLYSVWGKVKACILLRNRHTLGGYSNTIYMSFGTPDSVTIQGESRKHVIDGTLRENERGIYSRFTQWSIIQGCLYNTLEEPKRLYSVDDITDRRPYITTFSWSLEKYFCQRPVKSRYIGIVKGPGALTRRQLKSTIVCSILGLLVIYFIMAAALVYFGHNWGVAAFAVVVAALLTSPYLLRPVRRYKELVKLKVLKEENALRSVANVTETLTTFLQTSTEPESKNDGNGKENPAPVDQKEAGHRSDDDEEEMQSSLVEGPELVRVTSIAKGASVDSIESELKEKNGNKQRSVRFVGELGGNNIDEESAELGRSTRATANGAKAKVSASQVEWSGFSSDQNTPSMGVYNVCEQYRITEPTESFSIGISIFSFLLFVVLPTFCLYYIESWQLATIYLVLAAVVDLRHHTNAEVLVQEKGHLMTPDDDEGDDKQKWTNQSRLSQVAGTISRGKSYHGWRYFYIFFSLVMVFFGVQTLFVNLESRQDGEFTLVSDFYYDPQDSLHYQACEMNRNLRGNIVVSMNDYIFLSALVYRKYETTAASLSQWFGEGVLTDRSDIVADFREAAEDGIPVYYNLFTYEDDDGHKYAAVSVRGTQNAWDLFTDCQLWGAAALLQMIRALLPFGYIWNPILDEMIVYLSTIQTGSIERLSFFRSTTAFLEHLVNSNNYTSVVIMGHSLGGGLAIISGAQAHVQAVALSGPNAMISRHRFDITADELEKYTFNIIPDRDPIAMIDDPTKNLQRLECRAPSNSLIGCHSFKRSLCESLYVCGTGSRPAVCECTTMFGYPEPKPKANVTVTFEEACMGTGDGTPLMTEDQLIG